MRHHRTALLFVALAACAKAGDAPPPADAAPQEVAISGNEYAFTAPDTIAPGMTRMTLSNTGAQMHQVVLAQLADGKTLEDLMAFMQANPTSDPDFVTWVGGVGAIAPGQSASSVQDLAAGTYVLLCFVGDIGDPTPHIAKGMSKTLVVAGTANTAAAPTADLTIHLKDFAFDGPEPTAGTHMLEIVNDGPQVHELFLVKLDEGVSASDFLMAAQEHPDQVPPGTPLGGNGALSMGGRNWMSVTFEPGAHYALLCFVPDSGDGQPHVAHGMVREIAIPAS